MEPEWLFGMYQGGEVVEVGTCGEGGYFNDTDYICTCTEMKGLYKARHISSSSHTMRIDYLSI